MGEDIWCPENLIQCSRRLNEVLNKREFGLIAQDLDSNIFTHLAKYIFIFRKTIFSLLGNNEEFEFYVYFESPTTYEHAEGTMLSVCVEEP